MFKIFKKNLFLDDFYKAEKDLKFLHSLYLKLVDSDYIKIKHTNFSSICCLIKNLECRILEQEIFANNSSNYFRWLTLDITLNRLNEFKKDKTFFRNDYTLILVTQSIEEICRDFEIQITKHSKENDTLLNLKYYNEKERGGYCFNEIGEDKSGTQYLIYHRYKSLSEPRNVFHKLIFYDELSAFDIIAIRLSYKQIPPNEDSLLEGNYFIFKEEKLLYWKDQNRKLRIFEEFLI